MAKLQDISDHKPSSSRIYFSVAMAECAALQQFSPFKSFLAQLL
jgi:hypothetical protein